LGDLKDGGISIVGRNLVDTLIEIDGNNLVDCFGLSIGGGGANFSNVSINALNSSESGLLLRRGTTFLNNVHVSGFKVGVQIMSGAALVARRCEVFGETLVSLIYKMNLFSKMLVIVKFKVSHQFFSQIIFLKEVTNWK
jgi:hypothetical protein